MIEVIYLASAVFVALIACVIGPLKMHNTITGWDPSKVTDPIAFGNHVARGLFEFSAISIVLAAASHFELMSPSLSASLFVVVGVALVGVRLSQARKIYAK